MGATLVLNPTTPIDESLSMKFTEVMGEIRDAGRRGVFFRVPIEQAGVISIAARHGFRYHHADQDYAMLLAWLPDTPSPVPDFATHVLGVGGMPTPLNPQA